MNHPDPHIYNKVWWRRPLPLSLGLIAVALVLALFMLFSGSVGLPWADVLGALGGASGADTTAALIVWQIRIPMILTSAVAGAALAVAGLLLQTCFNNPLAGPSILGISTGSSLGVAVVMLWLGSSVVSGLGGYLGAMAGALAGAAAVMLLLLLMSRLVKGTAMLLIVGILIGYFASSAISLLNFFSTQEGVHSFVIWGLGTFSGVSMTHSSIFAMVTLPVIALSMLMMKPLDAMLLGDSYAGSMGIDVRGVRSRLLLLCGVLTAVVTAFCGPIGFIGLVVPHITRMLVRTSSHRVLLPLTALVGMVVAMLCAWIAVLPSSVGVIPVNAITPLIGVPVIVYVIVNRSKIMYLQ